MAEAVLPPLRQDLDIFQSAAKDDGSPTWTVRDPVRDAFFRIGWLEFQVFSRWQPDPRRLKEQLERETTLTLTPEILEEILRFLYVNQLVQASGAEGSVRLKAQSRGAEMPFFKRLFHETLCFRIPLVRPDRFLKATLPFVRPLFSRAFIFVLLAAAVVSVCLISRQSAVFFSTFLYFFDFKGMCAYAAAIVFAKSVHELGHAYAAALFGCRVPGIGLTFMMGCPMLYTDTTETWRLPRRQRFIVAASGAGTELALAVAASLMWVFLPDGIFRSICFLLATSGWIMTLCINLNPLMRFDGYYLLSDAWGIDNLRARADAFARWKIRTLLFGGDEPPPERLSPGRQAGFLLYAFASWIYRFFLWTGIALALYHFAFKALGIVLFLYAVLTFFIGPAVGEMRGWKRSWEMASPGKTRRIAAMVIVVSGLLVLFVPFQGTVYLPAMYRGAERAALYVPSAARVEEVSVTAGEAVKAGQTLARLFSPDLVAAYRRNEADIKALRWRRTHDAGNDGQVLAERLSQALAAREGYRKEGERLILKAPFDGVVHERAETLQPGEWVSSGEELFLITGAPSCRVEAFAPEEDVYRLKTGRRADFYPEMGGAPFSGRIEAIDGMPAARLGTAGILASDLGGPLPVRRRADGEAVPQKSYYRVRLLLNTCKRPGMIQTVRGTVRADAIPESLWHRLSSRIFAVLMREASL